MLNRVILTGRLTKDIEIKKSASGLSVTTFTVASDRPKSKDKEKETDFISCVAWRNIADYLNNYAHKGDMVALEGRLQTRSYDNTRGEKVYVTEVIVDNIQLLSQAQNNAQNAQKQATNGKSSNKQDNLFYNAYQEQKSHAQSQLANEQYVDATIEFDSDDLPF